MFKINEDWFEELKEIFTSDDIKEIHNKLENEYKNKIILPEKDKIFNAFNLCPYEKLSVVILGQDPYIHKEEANGLAFSVKEGIKLPPTLKNIFKEIENETNTKPNYNNGDLTYLAKQGVLLLNSVLTVVEGISGSHKNIGWEKITDKIIFEINKRKENIVFILWGNYAKKKINLINNHKNLILTSAHPSPLSATKFFNNNHFNITNEYLIGKNKHPIKWIKTL